MVQSDLKKLQWCCSNIGLKIITTSQTFIIHCGIIQCLSLMKCCIQIVKATISALVYFCREKESLYLPHNVFLFSWALRLSSLNVFRNFQQNQFLLIQCHLDFGTLLQLIFTRVIFFVHVICSFSLSVLCTCWSFVILYI